MQKESVERWLQRAVRSPCSAGTTAWPHSCFTSTMCRPVARLHSLGMVANGGARCLSVPPRRRALGQVIGRLTTRAPRMMASVSPLRVAPPSCSTSQACICQGVCKLLCSRCDILRSIHTDGNPDLEAVHAACPVKEGTKWAANWCVHVRLYSQSICFELSRSMRSPQVVLGPPPGLNAI